MNEPTWHSVTIRGIVQGVGFRPFVYRIASEMHLTGEVLNNPGGVVVLLRSTGTELDEFVRRIRSEAPAASRIERIDITEGQPKTIDGFRIVPSGDDPGVTLISPDLATCDDCLREMSDPDDPRYRYAFINCTHCGPRYTIIEGLPYDRPLTSMQAFPMCDYCRSEYENPLNRRFHAQPVACPECGPTLRLIGFDGAPIDETIRLLLQGKIVAIKGIGGFHLACDARNEQSVTRLRRIKQRPHKPFAVMVRPDRTVEIAQLDHDSEQLLKSTRAPIVILQKSAKYDLAESVAPDYPTIGVLYPYSPVHHLLLTDDLPFLVMTSANRKGEPIARDENEIDGLFDHCLTHDRAILNPCDDSVVRGTSLFRRSRGYVPEPIDLPFEIAPTLATGAELKSTFCVGSGNRVFVSPYLGSGATRDIEQFYIDTLTSYKKWFRIEPEKVVCDRHPDYFSSRFARETGLPLVEVQHHHAHIGAVMAEYSLDEKVIGVVYDGTGLGDDGTIWGGEIMLADRTGFERLFHLIPMPLPGGDAAVRKPQRAAYAWLEGARDFGLSDAERRVIQSGFNTPHSSGMGRLFDVVSVLLGFEDEITFEAQAAIRLENLCGGILANESPYPFTIDNGVIDHRPMLGEILCDHRPVAAIARSVHRTIIDWTTCSCSEVYQRTGIRKVVLCGGVMQNRILLDGLTNELASAGFDVYYPKKYPANDGAIALGQIFIAGGIAR